MLGVSLLYMYTLNYVEELLPLFKLIVCPLSDNPLSTEAWKKSDWFFHLGDVTCVYEVLTLVTFLGLRELICELAHQASHAGPPATCTSKLLWPNSFPASESSSTFAFTWLLWLKASFPRAFQIALFYHLHLTWNITSPLQQGFAWFLILFQPRQRSFQRRYNALNKSKKDMKPKPSHILLIY